MAEQLIGMGRLKNGEWYAYSRRNSAVAESVERQRRRYTRVLNWMGENYKFKAKAMAYFDRIRKDERLWK